jgi:hypothetical protein
MTQGRKFCIACGTPLVAEARFCGSCGKPQPVLEAPPVAPSGPPPAAVPPLSSMPPVSAPVNVVPPFPTGETLLGIVAGASRKKGFMAIESFNIIVTPQRMIFAVMTNEMISAEAKKAGKQGGFLAGMLEAATVGYTFYKRYLDMPPAQALAENPQNFAIALSQVRKVKLEAGKEIKTYGSMKANQGSIIKQHNYEQGKLEIETSGEKLSFNLPNNFFNMAQETLRKAGFYV